MRVVIDRATRFLMKASFRVAGYQDFDPRTNGERRFLAKRAQIGNGVVFDVGANEGNWARMALSFHPHAQVHCFEPVSAPFQALAADLGDRVRVHNVAVSDEPGSVVLHAAPESEQSSMFDRRHLGDANDEVVDAITVDQICRAEGIGEIALLKIDTEGNELAVLRGAAATLDRIRMIQFEYGGTAIDARIYLRDFFDLLGERFAFYRLHRFGMIHEPRWSELLEVAAYQNWVCIQRQRESKRP
jgi:FkbM family methyltransferase